MVALVFHSPASLAAASSGAPAGVASGLASLGYDVRLRNIPPPVDIGYVLDRLGAPNWLTAQGAFASSLIGFLRSYGGVGRNRAVPQVTLVSDLCVDVRAPYVTFDDMTVIQALREPSYDFAKISPSHRSWWIQKQLALYRGAVGCCVGSHWAARSVIDDYGIPHDKVHVVGRGHAVDGRPPPRDWATPRYLFVGRDWTRKNGQRVVAAFSHVRESYPDATLDIVGVSPGRALAAVPGIRFHGQLALGNPLERRRLLAMYAQATAFVMPSLCEAFGLSYVEAGARGIASVGTTNGGAADAIGNAGFLVNPSDTGEIATAMLALADPTIAEALGRAAYERSTKFTWTAVAMRLVRALHGSRPCPPDHAAKHR